MLVQRLIQINPTKSAMEHLIFTYDCAASKIGNSRNWVTRKTHAYWSKWSIVSLFLKKAKAIHVSMENERLISFLPIISKGFIGPPSKHWLVMGCNNCLPREHPTFTVVTLFQCKHVSRIKEHPSNMYDVIRACFVLVSKSLVRKRQLIFLITLV